MYIHYLWFAGFFSLPLFWWPWADVIFEVPKVYFFYFWIYTLLVGTVFSFKNLRPLKTFISIDVLVAVFFAIAIVTSILGADLSKSIAGNYYRGDGLITLAHLASFFYLTSRYATKKVSLYAFYGITGGVFTTCVWAIGKFLTQTDVAPVAVSFGNPNFLAGYLSVTLPVTYYLFRRSLGWYALLLLQLLAILATFSVGGVLTAFLATVVWIALQRGKKFLLVLVPIAICAGVLYGLRDVGSTVLVAEGRERIYRKTMTGALMRPLTGWGWANVDYAFSSNDWPLVLLHDVYVDKAHSTLLEVFATTGFFGLIAYAGIFLGGFYLLRLQKLTGRERLLFASLLTAYLVHSQTNITSIAEEVLFWFSLGILSQRKD